MKINHNPAQFENSVFEGGTCATSTWRRELNTLLNDNVPYFDPQLAPGEWNNEAAKAEDNCKKVCKALVFVLTPDSLSAYSGFEIGVLCTQNPKRMIFCAYGDFPADQVKGINKISRDVAEMGGTVCQSLEQIAELVNAMY